MSLSVSCGTPPDAVHYRCEARPVLSFGFRRDQEDSDIQGRVELTVPDTGHRVDSIRHSLIRSAVLGTQVDLAACASAVDIGKSAWQIRPTHRLRVDEEFAFLGDLQHNDSTCDLRVTRN